MSGTVVLPSSRPIHFTFVLHPVVQNSGDGVLTALVGVLVGGVLAFLGGVELSRLRMKALVRAAEQLIAPDLLGKSMAVIVFQNAGRWISLDTFPFFTDREAWREARGPLASGGREAWLTVSAAFTQLARIEQLASKSLGQPWSVSDRAAWDSLQSSIIQSMVLLNVLTSQPRWFRVVRRAKHWRQRRVAIRNVRAERLKQSQILASGAGPGHGPTPAPTQDEKQPSRKRRVFGNLLPQARPDEAYLKTVREWRRKRARDK